MKIAFFHNVPIGGARRVIYQQIKFLIKNNQVDIYQINSNGVDFLDFGKLGCRVYTYDFDIRGSFPKPLERLQSDFKNFISLSALHRKIAHDIDNENYDVVIVHPDKYTQAPYLLRFLQTFNIYYCHELLRIAYERELQSDQKLPLLNKLYELSTRKLRKNIDKKNAQTAKIIFANSEFTKTNIKIYYQRNAIVSYPWIDTSVFTPAQLTKKHDILFIGEKVEVEGYDLLMASIKGSDYTTHIYSRSNDSVLSEVQLVELFNSAKTVVCLSYNEPFGFIPLEAMSCGVPVVALDEGGYKETVVSGSTGILVNRNSHSLYNALNKLLTDDNLRDKMGKAARKHVVKLWSTDKRSQQFGNLLRLCLKQK